MKTNKLQNFITYFLFSLGLFILNFKNISLLAIILGGIISIFSIFLFEKLNLKKSKLFQLLLFLGSILLNIIFLNKITFFISDNILREFSNVLLSFTLILIIALLSYKGKHTITKILLLSSYFIFFILFIGLIYNIFYFKTSNITLKVLTSKNLLLETTTYTFILIYCYFITTSNQENFKFKNLIISNLFHFFLMIITIGILGSTLTNLYEYPYIVVFKKVSLIGFIERIEIIFSLNYLFIFNFFLFLSFYEIKAYLNNFLKKEKKLNYLFLLLLIIIFLISLTTGSKYTT